MSLEENPKEESDTTQNVAETEGKQVKERKSRKEKVKPLAKVKVLCELFFFFSFVCPDVASSLTMCSFINI